YVLPNLPTGLYRVTAAKEGFRAAEMDGVRLPSPATVRADFSLPLGSITTRVEVTSEAPMLDHSTPTLGSQLTNKQIHDSPLIVTGRKRDITAFLQFLPGVT